MNQLEVRRNQRLSALLGLVAAVMAIAYLQRAAGSGRVIDWLICVVMVVIAASQLLAMLDSRTPLLVADDQGVRVRLGQEWLGLPWAMIAEVDVEQREAPVRDGRLIVRPRDLDAALAPLLPSSRRAATWQRILHGAPLTIPLSIGTRTSTRRIVSELRELAAGRAEVVASARRRVETAPEPRADARRASVDEVPEQPTVIEVAAPVAPAPVAAVRAARKVMRAELVHERGPRTPALIEAVAPVERPVAPRPEPRTPVVGRHVREARERAGLDIDELSDRTRIRPHVLEGIEGDDFGPCGGDFYARGHLRTLARYLGLDGDHLVEQYDDRYAHAPIAASRVFEAELASGMSGGLKVATGGPRWGLIAAAVLSLVMVWGIARYFTVEPDQTGSPVTSNSAGLAANTHPITSPLTRTRTLSVHTVAAPARVVVRDRFGKVLWSGHLAAGAHRGVAGVAPFKVHTTNAMATHLRLGKHRLGPVSDLPGTATRVVG